MAENNEQRLPSFESLDDLTAFFDENDMGDFLDTTPEADFAVDIKRRSHYVAVDEEVADQISKISRHEHTPSGAIVNSWLREKISDYTLKH